MGRVGAGVVGETGEEVGVDVFGTDERRDGMFEF